MSGLFCKLRIELFHCLALPCVANITAGVAGIVEQPCEFPVEGCAANGHTVDGYVLIEKCRKSFLVSVIVELPAIDTVGDNQHDLSAAAVSIMEQLSGRIAPVVEGLCWPATKVCSRTLVRLANSCPIPPPSTNKGDSNCRRRSA